MYEGGELDHGHLRHCPGFELMQRSAYNERLGEVYLRDALASHPWRTRSAEEATLFFVPIWEVRLRAPLSPPRAEHIIRTTRLKRSQIVSFNVGECNGTTHRQRMARAAAALRSSLPYRRPRHFSRPAGFDHVIASTGCIEKGLRIWDRLTAPLAKLLSASIVGRDRACERRKDIERGTLARWH